MSINVFINKKENIFLLDSNRVNDIIGFKLCTLRQYYTEYLTALLKVTTVFVFDNGIHSRAKNLYKV
jgi:hypothetical protein